MSKMAFTKAVRKRAKLRLAVSGVAGSGKTTAALEIATGLLGKSGGRIAVIDTERGSASLYATSYEYDVMELNPPYSPERFIEAIEAAEKAGYDVLILDSITHEWNGSGGCCDINEALAQSKYRGNTWSAWSDTTPRHRAFLDAILQSNMHVIATMRSKAETVQGEDKKVRKVGMKTEQRDGTDYEFSVVFELEHQSHAAITTKDRTRLFGGDPFKITTKTGESLRVWLETGEDTPPTEAEVAAKRQQEFSLRFAQSVHPTGDLGKTEEEHEAAVAASVFAVHSDLLAIGEEEYRAVWNLIPAPSRAAIKKYVDLAKKTGSAATPSAESTPAGKHEAAGVAA
jgi:hypothetical protein